MAAAGLQFSVSISQSRCLSFQVSGEFMMKKCSHRFNLAIEMLIISGGCQAVSGGFAYHVSISQSRCLSFQVPDAERTAKADSFVSISQSRCLSFQVCIQPRHLAQPRPVSISQSRCLSFQVVRSSVAVFCLGN